MTFSNKFANMIIALYYDIRSKTENIERYSNYYA